MIHVKDNWYIDADESSYILKYDTLNVDKQGNKVYTKATYHSTIESALQYVMKWYQRKYVEAEKNTSIEMALREFQRINQTFQNILFNIQEVEKLHEVK